MAKFKIGDKVLVLPGNYRSGKVGTVVAFQDGDPAVQLEGLPEPEMFAEYELRLEKSLPTTDTKALLRAKYSKSFSGPLKAVLTTLLVKYGIAASSQVEYFPGDSGGYKITVQKRSDVDKAERLREEVEREFGVPVYVAF